MAIPPAEYATHRGPLLALFGAQAISSTGNALTGLTPRLMMGYAGVYANWQDNERLGCPVSLPRVGAPTGDPTHLEGGAGVGGRGTTPVLPHPPAQGERAGHPCGWHTVCVYV